MQTWYVYIEYFGQGLLKAISAIRISTSQYMVGLGDECRRRNIWMCKFCMLVLRQRCNQLYDNILFVYMIWYYNNMHTYSIFALLGDSPHWIINLVTHPFSTSLSWKVQVEDDWSDDAPWTERRRVVRSHGWCLWDMGICHPPWILRANDSNQTAESSPWWFGKGIHPQMSSIQVCPEFFHDFLGAALPHSMYLDDDISIISGVCHPF